MWQKGGTRCPRNPGWRALRGLSSGTSLLSLRCTSTTSANEKPCAEIVGQGSVVGIWSVAICSLVRVFGAATDCRHLSFAGPRPSGKVRSFAPQTDMFATTRQICRSPLVLSVGRAERRKHPSAIGFLLSEDHGLFSRQSQCASPCSACAQTAPRTLRQSISLERSNRNDQLVEDARMMAGPPTTTHSPKRAGARESPLRPRSQLQRCNQLC